MSGSTGGGAQVLREFVMRLGFATDERSQRSFLDSVGAMTKRMVELGAAVEAAAAGVVAGVAKMASVSEGLYYLSQRTGSSVRNINAFKFAFSELGSSSEEATALLEKFSSWIRETPGHIQLIESLTHTKYTGAVQGLTDLGKALGDMLNHGASYAQVRSIAEQLHISEPELQVLLRGTAKFTAEYKSMADKIIGDQNRIAENGTFFMQRYRSLLSAINDFAVRLGGDLSRELAGDMETLRGYLLQHASEITAIIDTTAHGILAAGKQIVTWVGDLVSGFESLKVVFLSLNPAQQAAVEALGLITAAIYAFNLAFRLSPLGKIALLATAITELFGDYTNWKNGAAHFINWEKWKPEIDAAATGMKWIGNAIDFVTGKLDHWQDTLASVANYIENIWHNKIVAAFQNTIHSMESIITDNPVFQALSHLLPGFNLGTNSGSSQTTPQSDDSNQPSFWDRLNQFAPDKLGAEARAWITGNSAKSASDPIVKHAVDFFKHAGRSAQAAAGMAANLYAESRLNPAAANASGHVGIAQWSGERQQRFHEYAKEMHLPDHPLAQANLDEQLGFYNWELKKYEPQANSLLDAAQSPAQGALGGIANERPEGYRSPGMPGSLYPQRAALAQQIYQLNPGFDVAAATAVPPLSGAAMAGTTINHYQNNNFHADAVTDPRQAVALLSQQLSRQNADLIRNGTSNVT
ncbi:phage tail tip lysozyme [Rhodopila sp.]|uniref:phage tail tip lysozyme n=1 Tax=Rhodopila sp. TaxID=2480087 RepID=UPI003D0D0B31